MVNHYFLLNQRAISLDEVFKHSIAKVSEKLNTEFFLSFHKVLKNLDSDHAENIRKLPMLIKSLLSEQKYNLISQDYVSELLELLTFESRLKQLQLQTNGLMRHGSDFFLIGDHFICHLKYKNPYLPIGDWIVFKKQGQLEASVLDKDLKEMFENIEEGISLNLISENTLRKALVLGILLRRERKK